MNKTFIVAGMLFVGATAARAQWVGVPYEVQLALNRIEVAFRTGDPASIEDMFPAGLEMRIEDSLYWARPLPYAIADLKNYFAGKDSLDFRFASPGSGTLSYSVNGDRHHIPVDVWLRWNGGEIQLYALNISNYPIATVFYHLSKEMRK